MCVTKNAAAMNSRLFLWSLTSALAGFLFGFDTVVISGAEQTIQALWELNDFTHGLAISMALWGTVLGSVLGGYPTDKFGRKKTLVSIGVLYLVSAIWSGLAADVVSFMVARFIGGVGVGISTIAAPLFISEIAPPAVRGRLTGMFQFNIVFGILVALVSNAAIGSLDLFGENAWRWMLGIEAVPAIIFTLMCMTLPESPRWLISVAGRRDEAVQVLQAITPEMPAAKVDQLAAEIEQAGGEDSDQRSVLGKLTSSRLRVSATIAFLVALFNQLSGINAILYFAPRIFGLTGLSSDSAVQQAIGIGVVNLIFTFVGLYLIDRVGRRTLLIVGSVGYILSLGLCALTFAINADNFRIASDAIELSTSISDSAAADVITQQRLSLSQSLSDGGLTELPLPAVGDPELIKAADYYLAQSSEASGDSGMIVLICIFAFIASHAVGQGAVIWVLIAEVFPNRDRAAGQSLGSFTHWIFAALLTLVFPLAVGLLAPAIVFAFFAFMMVLQLAWVMTSVPETKGIPLEQVLAQLNRHLSQNSPGFDSSHRPEFPPSS